MKKIIKKIMNNKQNAWKRGQLGESIAALYLRVKGYHILARQHRTPVGEIDIIARRGKQIIFVEVKTRDHQDDAAHAISPRQQSRIMRASEMFMQGRPDLAHYDMRFDGLLMAPWRWPVHLENAWQV